MTDERKAYMGRALQLAAMARGFTSPNPMVGAVIVARGRIIGEGYHRRCGGPHAEVWAVRSVAEADRPLLREATVYVTLEPCSHYGKTPPCADMLVAQGVRSVVVGCADPNPKVSGRGVARLRDAGIEVTVGVLENECLALNRPFMVNQILGRPYVLLKYAVSADGFMDVERTADAPPARFSTPLTLQSMHRLRAQCDAILVGSATAIADNPSLTVRGYAGRQPRPVVIDRRGRVPATANIFGREEALYLTSEIRTDLPPAVRQIEIASDAGPAAIVAALRAEGIASVMVEGGAQLLGAFIDSGVWDDARIEMSPVALGAAGCAAAPLPRGTAEVEPADGGNVIINVKNPESVPY